MMPTRRRLLQISALTPFMRFTPAWSADAVFKHALTLFDDIKYKADFKNFDYVNAAAPKGG